MSITKKKITNRLYVISFLLIVIIFSIVFKIIDLQFFKGDYYIDISEKREFKNIEIDTDFNSAHVSLEHHGEFDINTPDGKVRLIFDWLESTYLVEKDDELKFKFYFSRCFFK